MNINEQTYLDLLKDCLAASIYEESAWRIVESAPQAPKGTFKWSPLIAVRRFLIAQLRKRRLLLVRMRPFDAAARVAGKDWPCFGYTMVGRARLDNIEWCIRDVLERNVAGDFIETGVWRGGSAIFMRAMLQIYGVKNRVVWAADSFEGMPVPENESDGWDMSAIEQLQVSLDEVKGNFSRFGLLDDQVKFLKGWFKNTLPTAPIARLAILRMDGDLYNSTMDALTNLYDKMSPGGYVIVDDYKGWPGCRRAVHDFLDRRQLNPEIREIDNDSVFWRVGDHSKQSDEVAVVAPRSLPAKIS
jgi:O-methyltransferase